MNSAQALENRREQSLPQLGSRWFVTLRRGLPTSVPGFESSLIAKNSDARHFCVARDLAFHFPLSATRGDCAVVLDGGLYNRKTLEAELGEFTTHTATNDAEVVLAAYQRWGEAVFTRLRGAFALILWDQARDVLYCLRDPLGMYPLFFAQEAGAIHLSTSIEELLKHPGISRCVNRPALADYFLDRFPRLEETFIEAVKRVPPGHVLRVAGDEQRSYRYWDPTPGGKISWLTEDDIERFDELLDQAVTRCLSFGPAAIFLSGGLDSVSVAATALERSRFNNLPGPTALSLVFPEPDISEEIVQRSVASQLGLPHIVKPFYEAIGKRQLLEPAIELSASLPSPLINTWLPAFYGLGIEAQRQQCRTILTGNGGDEWLTISPYLSADLLRELNFRGVFRLGKNLRRSHRRTTLTLARALLWRFGAQPLLLPAIHGMVEQVAPWSIKLRRRILPDLPVWLAPDPALRKELKQRREEYAARKKQAATETSFYLREARKALDHPLMSTEMEEYFNVYRRAGLFLLHPFWDADLVDLLYRTPPFLLDQGGRNKGLVRSCLHRKFPNLGFERQVKLEATNFHVSSVQNEAPGIWRKLAGTSMLGQMGVVDEGLVSEFVERLLKPKHGLHAHRVWSVLNLEAWTRSHAS